MNAMNGGDYTIMYYYDSEGGVALGSAAQTEALREYLAILLERVRQGKIREYKRLICFDHEVLASDQALRSGVLRIGQGPGTIDPVMGEHCRLMIETKGCSLYVAPAIARSMVVFYGTDKVTITVETAAPDSGGRAPGQAIFFCDPPNGEIVEQFRQIERDTERRMVAVHKIVFPEDAETKAVAR